MKPALLVSLMLFLLVEARGIRVLQQEFASAGHQKFHEEKESSLTKESGGVAAVVGEAVAVLCKDGDCSGRSRKLEKLYTSSTSTYSKSLKNSGGTKIDGNEENFPVESTPVSGHGKITPEHYPDIIDIAGMDYSPARRKPPIHN